MNDQNEWITQVSPTLRRHGYNFDYKSSDQELWKGVSNNQEYSLLIEILDLFHKLTDLFVIKGQLLFTPPPSECSDYYDPFLFSRC